MTYEDLQYILLNVRASQSSLDVDNAATVINEEFEKLEEKILHLENKLERTKEHMTRRLCEEDELNQRIYDELLDENTTLKLQLEELNKNAK